MHALEQSFHKQTESLSEIFAFLSSSSETLNLPTEMIPILNLVVEEVFVNLVRYNTESHNDVLIRMDRDGQDLRVCLVDEDVDGYDLTQHADVDTSRPAHERRPGGLGIHFVKQMMDEVSYTHENRTSTITLVKHIGETDVEG